MPKYSAKYKRRLYRISITTDGKKEWYEGATTQKKIFEEQWWRAYADYAGSAGNRLVYNIETKYKIFPKTLIVTEDNKIVMLAVEEVTGETE